jgi:hypothetical protein
VLREPITFVNAELVLVHEQTAFADGIFKCVRNIRHRYGRALG